MPPALSDNESSDNDVPATEPSKKQATAEAEDEDEDEDEEDASEDEYIVEKILGHRFNKGVLEFEVKWQGYERASDRTWEPEANMETAADVLKEYFDDIGGRPEKPGKAAKTAKTAKAAGKAETGTKRKGRASIAKSETATPASSSKRAKQTKQVKEESVEKAWSPPPGSWEHDVSHIDTVEQSIDPKTGKEARYAYIVWNNQKKTQHPLKHIYTKCPQKMLVYYESHLVFTANEQNGDTMDVGF